MTYERINFVDQSVERPRTYEMTHNADGSVTLVDSFGLVDELGTPINADTMNHIEDGIAAGSFTKYSEKTYYKAGDLITIFKDDKLKVYKSLKDENINNSVESTDFWEEIELGGGSGAYKTGQVVLFDHILTYKESEGFERLGTYVYKSAVAGSRYGYPTFYEQCLKEYQEAVADGIYFKHENGHVFYDIANKAEVDAVYNSTGIAWAYGIDTANERIFLPRNDYYFKNGSADDVGNTVNQELPNIKGELTSRSLGCTESLTATGVFTGTHQNDPAIHSADDTERYALRVMFNASKSNSTYKDGGEVIPKSVSMIAYMVVGNTANEEAYSEVVQQGKEILEQVNEGLETKVDKDSLVETPVIIETYNITASNGYIVWSNGWCEQWGRGTAPSTASTWGTTITLNKKYWNKAYGITLTNWGSSTAGAALKWNSDTLTESTFQVLATVQSTSFNWRTWGVLAEGEY